jgi:hypothetical protein
MTFGGAPCPSL